MRPAGIYLLEVEIGQLKYENLPQGNILFTLRVGKNSTSLALDPILPPNNFAGVLQLNVDSSAIETQRCTFSFNVNTPTNKRLLGMAVISLPKNKDSLSNSYKLSQSEDKKAQIQLKIRICSLQAGCKSPAFNPEVPKEEVKGGESSFMSNIKIKSKHSDGSGEGDKKAPRNFKMMEDDRIIEITEKEVKRYKAEKQAYYQMYQLEKSKNQVASKFISTVIKKLTEKYPNLLPAAQSSLITSSSGKKGSEVQKNRNSADIATIDQLEQANRSLHRQIDQYKKVVDQLKQQIAAYAKPFEGDHSKSNVKKPSSFFDFGLPARQSSKQKSNIIPTSLKDNYNEPSTDIKEVMAGIDLKKWLNDSVGQRQELQTKFARSPLPPERPQNKAVLIKKLKNGIDKAFTQFLNGKDFSRTALLSHKQEVNRILDDQISV